MAAPGSLVERRGVGMAAERIVAIWIFSRVKQQSDDFDMTKIRSQSQCQMAILTGGIRKQPAGLLKSSSSRCHRQIDLGAPLDQVLQPFQFTLQGLPMKIHLRPFPRL